MYFYRVQHLNLANTPLILKTAVSLYLENVVCGMLLQQREKQIQRQSRTADVCQVFKSFSLYML